MLEAFFLYGDMPANVETGEYHLPLVILSYIVASFSCYTALSLARQLTNSQNLLGKRFVYWGGAFALGAGIWSMHFIGMLAYKMNMLMSYDPLLTSLSFFVSILTACGVLSLARQPQLTPRMITGGAVLLGIGISTMHYVGMAAMKMDARINT